MSKKPKSECTWCGEPLTPEELAHPCKAAGAPICCHCEMDHFWFTCSLCEIQAPKDEEGKIGLCIVVTEKGVATPGVYRVRRWPIFGQPMIGAGHLYEEAVEWVAPLPNPKTIDTQGAPCGYVCAACSEKFPTSTKKTLARSHP